jgi:predicted SAM-dependent methyltransferase
LNKIKYIIKKNIPKILLIFIQKIILIKRILSTNKRIFFCIFCNKLRSGYYTGYLQSEFELTCTKCFSVGRNRLLGDYIKTLILDNFKILHFAPERTVEDLIKKKKVLEYNKVDINPLRDQKFCDIENTTYKDESFDLIICSHVLEHVDYVKAIQNLKKIIKKQGTILLMFPIIHNWKKTYSDSGITTELERETHFGQFDHLHVFGRDILNEFNKDFEISERIAFGKYSIENGIKHGETLFIIKKIN